LPPGAHPGWLAATVTRPGGDVPLRASHHARCPPAPPVPRLAGAAPPQPGQRVRQLRPAGPDRAAASASVPWPRRPPCPDVSAPGPPCSRPARLPPSPAGMFPTPHRVETLAQSPGAGGHRPASGPLVPRGGGDAGRLQSTGRTPDSEDGPASGLQPAPPDCAARPAPDSPDTTAPKPQWQGTAPQAPRHGGAPGLAAPLGP